MEDDEESPPPVVEVEVDLGDGEGGEQQADPGPAVQAPTAAETTVAGGAQTQQSAGGSQPRAGGSVTAAAVSAEDQETHATPVPTIASSNEGDETPHSILEHVLLAFMSCTLAFMCVFLFMFTKHPTPDPTPVPTLSAPAMSVFIPPITVVAIAIGVYAYWMTLAEKTEQEKRSKYWWDFMGVIFGFFAILLGFIFRQRWMIENPPKPPHSGKSERLPFSVSFNLSCYFMIALFAMVMAKITNRIFLCQNLDEPLRRSK